LAVSCENFWLRWVDFPFARTRENLNDPRLGFDFIDGMDDRFNVEAECI